MKMPIKNAGNDLVTADTLADFEVANSLNSTPICGGWAVCDRRLIDRLGGRIPTGQLLGLMMPVLSHDTLEVRAIQGGTEKIATDLIAVQAFLVATGDNTAIYIPQNDPNFIIVNYDNYRRVCETNGLTIHSLDVFIHAKANNINVFDLDSSTVVQQTIARATDLGTSKQRNVGSDGGVNSSGQGSYAGNRDEAGVAAGRDKKPAMAGHEDD